MLRHDEICQVLILGIEIRPLFAALLCLPKFLKTQERLTEMRHHRETTLGNQDEYQVDKLLGKCNRQEAHPPAESAAETGATAEAEYFVEGTMFLNEPRRRTICTQLFGVSLHTAAIRMKGSSLRFLIRKWIQAKPKTIAALSYPHP